MFSDPFTFMVLVVPSSEGVLVTLCQDEAGKPSVRYNS